MSEFWEKTEHYHPSNPIDGSRRFVPTPDPNRRPPVYKSKEYKKFNENIYQENNTFSDFCRKKGLHHCAILSLEHTEIYGGCGPSIIFCAEDETGFLYAGNDEIDRESVVNFCPFCGYQSKQSLPFHLEPAKILDKKYVAPKKKKKEEE